ncbi:MAG: rhomboid family intramembrane serine protease [Porticoccaceae bacterium]|nr:rhomboid family intramembrane serine protease [Porticoccaceae bacterium]
MKTALLQRVRLVAGLAFMMVFVFAVDTLAGIELHRFGVSPRDTNALPGVLAAPFIHGSSGHLLANLVGFILLSGICLLHSVKRYLLGSLFIIVLGGLLVWVFGRDATHIGASGWIFGLWGLCIASALFDRGLVNILTALLAIGLYGGMIYGLLPGDPGVSFESHIFGALAGVLFAWVYARKNQRRTP